MDDFAGTQVPVRRLTDPAEAIAELENAVPNLASLRLPEVRNVNWQVVEAELGATLPEDFKLLCERYPAFALGDFLGLGGPEADRERSWVQGLRETLEIIEEWCAEADLTVPLHPYPAPGGLLP
ncbi:hypothetical protein KCMC57_up27630 [Kitasatospora sp. CMC57]|uniref:Uncharacterized protein n=1 Tax=Kitasatospora sp. CMC57 TaxID=3231513 RepID=A0AB33JY66_9ACTN